MLRGEVGHGVAAFPGRLLCQFTQPVRRGQQGCVIKRFHWTRGETAEELVPSILVLSDQAGRQWQINS